MCTSITMKTNDFYFGRTMDLDYDLSSSVVITPRNYPIRFRRANTLNRHYALIGMAVVKNSFPLYAEAANEQGLCIAGLNFPDNAWYPSEENPDCSNISPFELPLWLLGQCASLAEARTILSSTSIVNIPFSDDLPLTPMHWHIADQDGSVALEVTRSGLQIHDNPVGVLTNNPTFDFQMTNLCQYMNLISGYPQNCFSDLKGVTPFGQGLGSFGLPGDYSPASRFVKSSWLLLNSVCSKDDPSSIAQFFHLLDSVSVVRGSVLSPKDACDMTTYSCCINVSRTTYYYKTYTNNQLNAIDMRRENLNASSLRSFPLATAQKIAWAN